MLDNDKIFLQQVKKALAHFNDMDYLSTCPLASFLLPDVSVSADDRGKMLQCLLQQAVERSKPLEPLSHDNRGRWRLYYIIHYRYICELDCQQVMDKLSISAATFRRDQHKAIAAVSDLLRDFYPLDISSPSPPRIRHFVGRKEELAAYCHHLEEEGFAIIAGPPGVGKTSLGAELAAEWREKGCPPIWTTFSEGQNTSLEAILEAIALSLAASGQGDYWRFLQAERRKERSLSLGSQTRYLLTLLEQSNYMLCLDDFQLVNEDKGINTLCADLLQSVQKSKLRLLVMSRVMPRFAREHLCRPLMGLERKDAYCLLEQLGLPALSEAVFAELYAKTAGLPVFLKLFAAWAHGHGLAKASGEEAEQRMTTFVVDMVKEQDVRSYLLHEVYDTLNLQERRFLTCVSVFRGPLDTEEKAIIALLAAEGIEDIEGIVVALAAQHIFTSLEERHSVNLHPIVRAYFNHRLRMSPNDQTRIQRRVGEYYEQSRGDALAASHHYSEAGDYERAARLLSQTISRLVNAGQAEAALNQLELLTSRLAPTQQMAWRHAGASGEMGQGRIELRFEIAAAREALCHLLGQREKQRSALGTMLALAEEMDDLSAQAGERRLAMVHNRRARFHEVLGELAAAITAAEAGQAAARRAGDQIAEAESLNRWGAALWRRGDYFAARERHELALALARQAGDRRSEAECLSNLGIVHRRLGNYDAARSCSEQARDIWQAIGDQQSETINVNNLGAICCELGEYVEAHSFHKQALIIRQAIGDRRGEMASLNNLGAVCIESGELGAAQMYLEQAIAIALELGDQQSQAVMLSNLGEICCNLGSYTTARAYCERAHALARTIGDQQIEASSLNNLGLVCYKLGDYPAAQAHCERASIIYRAIGERMGLGNSLTYLGLALEGLGDLNRAETTFREALNVRREIGQATLAMNDVAGLARVALAKSEVRSQKSESQRQEAKEYVEECLAHIVAHGTKGLVYPFEIYLTCARILEACGERERARTVLAEAHTLLMQWADKIDDESSRRSFLENVPANHEVMQMWAALAGD